MTLRPKFPRKRSLPSKALTAATAIMMTCTALPAFAQQNPAPPSATAPAPAKPAKSAAPKGEKTEKSSADSGLKQRVDTLEEQLVDLQVAIGTIESFAKSNGAQSASPAYRAGAPSVEAPADTGKIAGLEQQIRTLNAQVQALTEQVRTLSKDQRTQAYQPAAVAAVAPAVAPPAAVVTPAAAPAAGFGTQTVTAGDQDAMNAFVKDGANTQTAAAQPPAEAAGDPAVSRQAYETAYGFLLQQDYGAAESAFDEFLKRFPADTLAGNAQFWLGETYYVRGQFKPAAAAFLKGYQTYNRSTKAPDSLLKLAMSLNKLGQKDAACSSLSELTTRFPAASVDVKSKAVSEKQRLGCA